MDELPREAYERIGRMIVTVHRKRGIIGNDHTAFRLLISLIVDYVCQQVQNSISTHTARSLHDLTHIAIGRVLQAGRRLVEMGFVCTRSSTKREVFYLQEDTFPDYPSKEKSVLFDKEKFVLYDGTPLQIRVIIEKEH